jgi:two-component system sensor histidine kinase RegB
VEVIEAQLSRCKKILSEILSSSGKERLEQATIAPVKEVFGAMIKEWIESRKPENLIYNFEGKSDKKVLLEDILAQAFFNIFDNALEESPAFISVSVLVAEDNIVLSVEDQGKGFDPEIIKQIGKPNLTTKNSSGLGLFLALNTLHRIGGDLKVENLSTGGAKVLVTLPLKNL